MPITFTFTSDDGRQAQNLHQRATSAWRSVATGLLLVNAALYFFGLLGGWVAIWTNPLCLLATISLPIATLMWLLWRRLSRRNQPARPAPETPAGLDAPFFTLTEEGLRYSTAFGQALRPWSFFHHWKEDAAMFLLYLNDWVYMAVPKRIFTAPDALTDMRRHLAALPQPTAENQQRQRLLYGGLSFSLLFLAFIQLALLPH